MTVAAPEGVPQRAWEWAASHPAAVGTSFVFLFAVIRLMRVAHGDPTTALTLAAESGPLTILLVAMVAAYPFALVVALIVAMRRPRDTVADQAGSALVVVLASTTLRFVMFIVVGVLVIVPMVARIVMRRRGREDLYLRMTREATPLAAIICGSLFLFAGGDIPWFTPEVLDVRGAPPTVAFVTSNDGTWLTVLVEEDRSIRRVLIADVQERTPCVLPSLEGGQTLFGLLESDKPSTPPCPD